MAKKYRDGLFRDYFNNKSRLLLLCNGLLGTEGNNPNEIKINTLRGTFFENLKNDLSCIYRDKFLVIVEHQTTINENMPLRIFLYAAELFKRYMKARKNKIYMNSLLRLPCPEFFVLYNGDAEESERREMRLSDAFGGENNFLEVVVKVYNINAGFNEDLISKVRPLNEYCTFVNRVKENKSAGMRDEYALAEAFSYCQKNDIMTEYLSEKEEELASMLGFEYDEEEARQAFIEYGDERGSERTKLEMVKKMLDIKIPVSQIIQVSGWSKDKVLSLSEEN